MFSAEVPMSVEPQEGCGGTGLGRVVESAYQVA
jgi:hypothetical protein